MMRAESSHSTDHPGTLIQGIEIDAVIERVKQGEADAFAGIIKNYELKVRTLIFRMVQNWEDAYDLSQETFLSAFQNIHKYKLKSNFQSWLFTIASRKALDLLRKRKSRPVTVELENEDERATSGSVEDQVLNREISIAIERAIQQLPHEQKVALTLSVFENFSTKEIAETLRISLKSAEMHIYRARNTLKTSLGSFLQAGS
jgi:RNA polymerase sigma-70 factor (ECF subfamily)